MTDITVGPVVIICSTIVLVSLFGLVGFIHYCDSKREPERLKRTDAPTWKSGRGA